MREHRYEVGDRVQLLQDDPGGNIVLRVNDIGTVVDTFLPHGVGVCWDVERNADFLHSCDNHCDFGYGWYVNPDLIAPIEETVIDLDDLI